MSNPPRPSFSASTSESSLLNLPERPKYTIVDLLPGNQLFPETEPLLDKHAPFRVQWECFRVASSSGCPFSRMLPIPRSVWDNYEYLWRYMAEKTRGKTSRPIRRVAPKAWEDATSPSGSAALSGSLTLSYNAEKWSLASQMSPVGQVGDDRSYRLARAFGWDRFITMTIVLDAKPWSRSREKPCEWLKRWLREEKIFLSRTWRAIFVREKKQPSNCYDVKFFATQGAAISEGMCARIPPTSIGDAVSWLIPINLESNRDMQACKLFSRIELGFSKTYPTVQFHPDQIVELADDFGDEAEEDCQFNDNSLDWTAFGNLQRSSRRAMNDGCARISVEAANTLWKHFSTTEPVPSAFQGRIGNAKGMWLRSIDREKDAAGPTWIETTESQRKFQRHDEDKEEATCDVNRVTFELLAWSGPLNSSHLSVSLLPILEDRGVSRSSIAKFIRDQVELEEDLFFNALNDPASLLKWTSDRFPRASPDGDSSLFQGSMPKLRSERIARLLKAGFEPYTCGYLSSLISKGVEHWLNHTGNKIEPRIPQSTSAFGVVDFQHVLRPGEVFLSFSRAIPDAQLQCLHNKDVLVARYPMHRPSDVQKVRAVYCPELAAVHDVIVFSARGRFPLAEKLSNGDYDGDRYWICWEPLLVEEFRNAPPPVPTDPKSLGINVASESFAGIGDVDGLLAKCFDLQVSDKVLGICANYQEKYAYEINDLSTPKMVRLSDLRDCLVDAPKNGYRFTTADWNRFLHNGKYTRNLGEPAYKESIEKRSTYKDENIVDYIKFAVIKELLQDFRARVRARFQIAESKDEHLTSLYERVCGESDHKVREEIARLDDRLATIVSDWKQTRAQKNWELASYDDDIEWAYNKFQEASPENTHHPVVHEWLERPWRQRPSTWDLLKASALYSNFMNNKNAHFVFSMAGRELLLMKALSVDSDAHVVTSSIMSTFKLKTSKSIGGKL